MIKISVYYEDRLVTEFEQADGNDISIGRAAGCSIHLDEASISRLHAVIRILDGGWVLERRASFGAVLLNGNEVENAPLEGGEDIVIGKFNLRVNIEGASGQQAMGSVSSIDAGIYQEDGDERTSVVNAGVSALFRFEPGTANISEFLMESDVAVFGRGSNCDVVLTEKKASRKHCEIRRQGLSFFLKDLNSANGLTVNGNKVTEAELVPGDVIQIGEAKIQFVVENRDFFSRQDQFMPVPAHLEQAPRSENAFPADQASQFPAYGADPMAGQIPGLPGMEGGAPGLAPEEPPLSSTDFIGRAKRAWSSVPEKQRKRYLIILVAFAFITALLGGPDEPRKPPPKRAGNSKIRTFEQLTTEKKKFVAKNYADLLKSQEKKDYTKMLDHTRNILTYVDDYKDTKSYEAMAKKKIEEIEEEKRRAEAERRQEETRQAVKALEEKGKVLYDKALNEKQYRLELDSLIQEIYTKDPNNRLAQQWKDGIKAKDRQDEEEAEAARKKEERRQLAESELESARRTFEAGKFIQALAEADKVPSNGWSEDGFPGKVEALRAEIRDKLSSIIDPLLKEAASQRQEGGDLVKANELYNKVLEVDATNRDALGGKASIKEILHLRAKRFYAEAVLAESLSNLTEAKDKFEKCLRTAPDEDAYKRRCKQKLARFEYFNAGSSGPSF